jgi:hypothetical protein
MGGVPTCASIGGVRAWRYTVGNGQAGYKVMAKTVTAAVRISLVEAKRQRTDQAVAVLNYPACCWLYLTMQLCCENTAIGLG